MILHDTSASHPFKQSFMGYQRESVNQDYSTLDMPDFVSSPSKFESRGLILEVERVVIDPEHLLRSLTKPLGPKVGSESRLLMF